MNNERGESPKHHSHRSLQVFPELRGEHARRLRSTPGVLGAYVGTKWDLGRAQVPPNSRRFTRLGLAGFLAQRHFNVVELPEPLWLRELPFTTFLAVVIWIRARLTRSESAVVFYAIENNRLDALVGTRWVHRLMRLPVAMTARTLLRLCSRCVFGSPAAQAVYMDVARGRLPAVRLILELPEPAVEATEQPAPAATCAFVGELSYRKGIQGLMTSWEVVEARVPDASLAVIGDGPLREVVSSWCAARPDSREWLGQVEATRVREELRTRAVLVAPSIRWGRWREQIGLPVKEALSVGSTVVTTDETGLASWLADTGHTVVPVGEVDTSLASAIEHALIHPLDRGDVARSLPPVGGRATAHQWLHSNAPSRVTT